MEKFMYLFRGGSHDQFSPEGMQAHMQKWFQWMQSLTQSGISVTGEPLKREGRQVNGSKMLITDGPYTEAKELVGGYLIVSANDLDHATEISKGCPILEVDGNIEIRPIQKLEM